MSDATMNGAIHRRMRPPFSSARLLFLDRLAGVRIVLVLRRKGGGLRGGRLGGDLCLRFLQAALELDDAFADVPTYFRKTLAEQEQAQARQQHHLKRTGPTDCQNL